MNYKNLEQEFSDYSKLVGLIAEYEDMQEIVMAMRGVSSAIDIAKKVTEVAQASNNADLVMAIADLKLELANAKIELSNALTETEKLQREIEKLKSPEWQLEFDDDNDAYYLASDIEKKIAYCPNCWDNKKEKHSFVLRDMFQHMPGVKMAQYECSNCKRSNHNLTPKK